jgi:heme O synthase-like polyprenyltransferase
MFYGVAAALLGAGFFMAAVSFRRRLDRAGARRLFLASIIYLPLVLALLAVDKALG